MAKGSSKAPSQRQLRVGEEIRHVLSDIFLKEDFYDENRNRLTITFSEVRISPDLRNATVYSFPLGGKNISETISTLNRLEPTIRRMVAQKIRMRSVPMFVFKEDNSFVNAKEIDDLLNKEDVKKDLNE